MPYVICHYFPTSACVQYNAKRSCHWHHNKHILISRTRATALLKHFFTSFSLSVVVTFKSSVILWYDNCAACFFKPKKHSTPSLGRYNLRKHRTYFGLYFHASCLCSCLLPIAECSHCYLQAAAGQAKSLGMACPCGYPGSECFFCRQLHGRR